MLEKLLALVLSLFSTTSSVVPPVLPPFLPTRTPMAFYEMTIPYLRSRSYESRLGGLQQVGQNAQFTSYLTSYDSDGLQINGLLTIPRKPGPHPAVIFVHGYIPPASYRTTVNYASYVNYLAARGLVVFKIDLRGHGDSEGEAGGAYYSSDYVIDVLNAYTALKNEQMVKSVGLWGHSMAGNVVSRSIAVKPEIQAAVIWAGAGYTYEDIAEYGIDDNSYQPPSQNTERSRKRQLLRETHGDFDSSSEFWKQIPATNYLSDFQGKLQLHHAVDDNVVSIDYSRNLVKLFPSVQLFEYATGGHNLTGSSFTSAMQRSADFYLYNL